MAEVSDLTQPQEVNSNQEIPSVQVLFSILEKKRSTLLALPHVNDRYISEVMTNTRFMIDSIYEEFDKFKDQIFNLILSKYKQDFKNYYEEAYVENNNRLKRNYLT